MLSNTCKYGIRAVLYLAQNIKGENKIGIKKISKDLNIPTPFLGKILQTLAKNKILSSTKGPHGGFGLNKDPYKLSLYDIVVTLDGEDLFNDCLISIGDCASHHSDAYYCPVHDKFSPIKEKLIEFFQGENIGQLIDDIKTSGKKIRI